MVSSILLVHLILTIPLSFCKEESPWDVYDTSRNLVLPNFRMFSEIKNIFYHMDTGHPVPIKYVKEIPGTDLLTKGFGLIPCTCHQKILECACCAYVKIQRFGFERSACSNLSVNAQNLELDLTINYSGYTLANRSLSLRHPPPFCIPTPQIPALLSCVRVHHITIVEGRIEFCINFEIKVVAIQNPVFVLEFTCVNYGRDGFVLERPSVHHHLHDNSSQPQMSSHYDILHSHLAALNSSESTLLSSTTLEGSKLEASSTESTKPTEAQTEKKTESTEHMKPHQTNSSKEHLTTPLPSKPLIEAHYSYEVENINPSDSKFNQRTQDSKVIPNENVNIVSLNIFDKHTNLNHKKSGGYLTFDGF